MHDAFEIRQRARTRLKAQIRASELRGGRWFQAEQSGDFRRRVGPSGAAFFRLVSSAKYVVSLARVAKRSNSCQRKPCVLGNPNAAHCMMEPPPAAGRCVSVETASAPSPAPEAPRVAVGSRNPVKASPGGEIERVASEAF